MSTGAPVPAASPAQVETPLSQPARILDVFIAPSKTFADLNRSTSWWMAWLLIAISSIAFVYTADAKVGFEKMMENEFRLSPKQADRFERIPEPQRTQQWNLTIKITKWSSYGSPVIVLVGAAILAGLFLATFNFGFGETLTFGKTFALVIYSSLPGILGSLLAIAGLLAGANPDGFFLENPAATNLGFFIDPLQSPVLYRFASHLDIFSIWTIVLLGIGFSCICKKVKRSTGIAVVFGWWILYVLAGLAKNLLTA